MYNAKELICQAFDACDKRVFAFKANPCQNDLILYSRAKKAINIAARKSNANLTELMLLTYIIDKSRKINIDSKTYIYSYEARWDSADTLSCHFGTEARYTKRVLKTAHTKMLICSNGIQGRKKREYRLGDLVIDIAKMTDYELSKFDYASYLTQKESVKKAKLWKTLISRVSKWRQNVQCPGKTLYQCPQKTLYQCPPETLEKTKEENKLELNTCGQTYPQAQSDITQHIDNDNQGEDDQQSCSIDFKNKKTKTKKRDVINYWQTEFFSKDEKGKSEYPYLGSNFAKHLYESIRQQLKYEVDTEMVGMIGVDILVACTLECADDSYLAFRYQQAKARKRLDQFWQSDDVKLAASEIAAKIRREAQFDSEML